MIPRRTQVKGLLRKVSKSSKVSVKIVIKLNFYLDIFLLFLENESLKSEYYFTPRKCHWKWKRFFLITASQVTLLHKSKYSIRGVKPAGDCLGET